MNRFYLFRLSGGSLRFVLFLSLFFLESQTDLCHYGTPALWLLTSLIASSICLTNSPSKVTPLWKPFLNVDDAQRRFLHFAYLLIFWYFVFRLKP